MCQTQITERLFSGPPMIPAQFIACTACASVGRTLVWRAPVLSSWRVTSLWQLLKKFLLKDSKCFTSFFRKKFPVTAKTWATETFCWLFVSPAVSNESHRRPGWQPRSSWCRHRDRLPLLYRTYSNWSSCCVYVWALFILRSSIFSHVPEHLIFLENSFYPFDRQFFFTVFIKILSKRMINFNFFFCAQKK